MSARVAVRNAIVRALADRGSPPREVSDEQFLGEDGLGLDSLDMATIVAELDAVLQKDPFGERTPQFRTVGDFVKLYENEPP